MSVGDNIKRLREERKLTQERLAEKLDVSFQAISSWERGEYNPETDKIIKLAEVFDVSISNIVEENKNVFKTKDAIYDWEHMVTFVKTTAKNLCLENSLRALDFAIKAHEGQKRKKSDIPYIYHPLNMACHALAMGIKEDDIIATCLLHDVIEDCNKNIDDLPVNSEIKELVRLLTQTNENDDNRSEYMKIYYKGILGSQKAALVKCIDRCNNLTTMSWGLSRDKIYRMITETDEYYPKLLKVIKDTPRYNDAAFLLQYQIESMLDIYKRLM